MDTNENGYKLQWIQMTMDTHYNGYKLKWIQNTMDTKKTDTN